VSDTKPTIKLVFWPILSSVSYLRSILELELQNREELASVVSSKILFRLCLRVLISEFWSLIIYLSCSFSSF